MSPRQVFEHVLAKGVRDWSFVRANLDQAETIAGHFESLIDRYLREWRSPAIPSKLDSFYSGVSERMILFGLFIHFICFGSSNRVKFTRLDPEQFYRSWAEDSVRGVISQKLSPT